MKKRILTICLGTLLLGSLTGCFSGKTASSSGRGGEVTGVGKGGSFREPTPYGMTLVKRAGFSLGKEVSCEGYLSRWFLDG